MNAGDKKKSRRGKSRSGLPPARGAALQCLEHVLFSANDVQSSLDKVLREFRLDARDAGLATELCYGYLRYKGRVDFVVRQFLSKPGKLPPALVLLLGVAAYEMYFLDKVPAYATVDWAVNHAKRRFGKGLSGLANAVLRKLSNLGEKAADPSFYKDTSKNDVEFFSAYYSCPFWIVRLWFKAYGKEHAEKLLAASVQAPLLGIRVNRQNENFEQCFKELSELPACKGNLGHGLLFPSASLENVDGMSAQGVLSRQSFAAQEAMISLNAADWESPVWDACSGRGGKTMFLLEQGKEVFSSDVHAPRLRGLQKELKRLGLPDIPVFRARADQAPLRVAPRTIVLDVPCSGLGVLSRRPDSKWRRTPEHVRGLVEIQRAILEHTYALVPEGGKIAYITCTLNPEENELQTERFMENTPGAYLEKVYSTDISAGYNEFFWGALLRKGKI